SPIDQAAAVADLAILLQLAQHLPCRAVLDGPERIVPFELGKEREFRGRTHLIDPHHRRGIFLTGEQLEYVVIDPRLMVHLNRAGNLTPAPEGVSRPGAGRNSFKHCVLSSSSSSS